MLTLAHHQARWLHLSALLAAGALLGCSEPAEDAEPRTASVPALGAPVQASPGAPGQPAGAHVPEQGLRDLLVTFPASL